MKIKTVLLSGIALRYAVAMALGMSFYKHEHVEHDDDQYWVLFQDGSIRHAIEDQHNNSMNRRYYYTYWQPDENDSQGGPICDEHHICTVWDGSCWIGSVREPSKDTWHHNQTARTRLQAAMRTLVSKVHGSEVNLPDGIHCT